MKFKTAMMYFRQDPFYSGIVQCTALYISRPSFNIPYHLKIYLIINRSCPYYCFMYVFMSQNSVSTIKLQSNKSYLKAIVA